MARIKARQLTMCGIVVSSALALLTGGASAQDPAGGARGPLSPAAAADTATTVADPSGAVFIDKKAAQSARQAAASALRAKASQRGVVRVIVGLGISTRAPHELSEAEATAQQSALRSAQQAVVSRVMGIATDNAAITHFDYIPFSAMNVTAAQLDRLMADPAVISIQEDVAVPPTLTQSVPFINADDVWAAGFPGTGFTVAILDTGVDKTHNMFPAGKIVSEACYSSTVPGQSTAVCARGSFAANSGVNCALSISSCNHGTHVAGIAAGNMAAPLLRGVAKNSNIIAIQVFSRFDSAAFCGSATPPCVRSWQSDQIAALQRVYALRTTLQIAAANMSLGGGLFHAPCDSTNAAMKAQIDLLRSARIATVIASGNDGANGSISAPACISSAIAVGSTLDNANSISSFSNHGAQVRLMAPGSNITSSVPPGPTTTATFSGTSMAAPHVAGAFALLRDVRGGSTVDDIAAALECSGVPVTRAGITEPRIDVDAARAYLLAPPNTTRSFLFSTAAEAAQWAPFTGAWSVNTASPPRFYFPAATGGWKLSTTANCNENVTITSRMVRIWPAGQRNNAGIAFKTQLSVTNHTMHGYMAAINRDLPGDDHAFNVVLWRFDGVNMITGAGPSTLLCNKDLDAIASGVYYTLKVVSAGGVHQVFVDNVLQCSATDRTYGAGRAGVITFNDPTKPAGNGFRVDTFTIDPNEVVPPASVARGVASSR